MCGGMFQQDDLTELEKANQEISRLKRRIKWLRLLIAQALGVGGPVDNPRRVITFAGGERFLSNLYREHLAEREKYKIAASQAS